MGLSRTVSGINSDFSQKSHFPSHRVFNAPAEGVPLGIEYRHQGSKTRMMGLPGRERSLTIYSTAWITIHECDGQTDGETDTGHSVVRTCEGKQL